MITAVITSYVAAAVAQPVHRGAGRRTGLLLAVFCLGVAAYFASHLDAVQAGGSVRTAVSWVPSLGVEWAFSLDGLSLLLSLVVCVVGAAVVLHASGYLAGSPRLGKFYAALMAFMASMLGLLLADNLLTLFVFWELTSVTSYLLIGFYSEREEARSAAWMALLITGLGGLALLAGLVLLGNMAGTYSLSELASGAGNVRSHSLYLPALLLILLGAFTKSAQFPFHFWLPGAMTAPAPASAYLHAATMVKAGVYLLFRLLPVMGATASWQILVGGTGLVTMLIGAVQAYRERQMKRILAYSTVSALGTMVFLLGIGSDLAVKAAVVVLLAHAFYKGALFLVAGNVEHEAGTADISKLGGLRRALPWTATAALVAGVGMAGLPPTLGFLGKETLLMASGAAPGVVWLIAGIAAFGIAASGLVAIRPFFGSLPDGLRPHEAGLPMLAGPVVMAAVGVLLGLLAPFVGGRLIYPAVASVTGVAPVKALTLWHGWTPELGLSALSIAAGVALYWQWDRVLSVFPPSGVGWNGARVYEAAISRTLAAADWTTASLQSGYLRRYLGIAIFVAVALAGFGLLQTSQLFRLPALTKILVQDAALVSVVAISGLAVAITSRKWVAIVALGGAGYGVGMIFLTFGAPDLALTQFVVETLLVVLLVFAIGKLSTFTKRSPARARIRDAMLATVAGVVMTGLTLASLQVQSHPSISEFFAAASVPEAHGRNIVNVILVDFRALDTLGEITVIAVAALGVAALLRLRRRAT